MIQTLLTSLPLLVCLFWAATLVCDIALARRHTEALATSPGWVRPRRYLLLFLVVTTILYFGHYIYFNRLTPLLPTSDSLYVAANLAVYPLYYLYICTLTQRKGIRRRQLALLLPAIAGGTAAALPSIVPDIGIEADAAVYGDYEYQELSDGSIRITKYNGTASK